MPKPKKSSRPKEVELLVGTRKGGFRLRSDLKRKSWQVEGPLFGGWEVNHLTRDPRSGRLWAALNVTWWGNDVQVSDDNGKSWQKSSAGLEFAPERNLKLNRIWHIAPDRASRPDTLWCGVDPGALFRSDDGGRNWSEVRSLTEHSSRDKWQPGGGGLMVHTILPDPERRDRLYVGISAAGCFGSDDDGRSWRPLNQGTRIDYPQINYPEVGQCVHRMAFDPKRPGVLYQQNHFGQYRSEDGAATWTDISEGLPSRFGFPLVTHPHESGTIYVLPAQADQNRYTPEGRFRVYRSRNGGRSWQALTRGLPQKNAWLLVLRHAGCADPCDSPGIYFGATTGELFYSANGGDSWQQLPAHFPPILSLEAAVV